VVVGRRALVIFGDQNGKGREVEGPMNDGGEGEVLKMDGGATERLAHVLHAMAAHRLLRRAPCSG
jgi:hypothetical protein